MRGTHVGYRLAELAERTGARLVGDPGRIVTEVATLAEAGPQAISFLANPRYRRYLPHTQAGAVILAEEDLADCPVDALVSSNPYLTYARVAALLAPPEPVRSGIHPAAVVADGAEVDPTAWIGPQAVVEAGARVGPGVLVGPGSVVGAGAELGADTRLVARVTVCHGVRIGARVVLHPGAVIGSDGFGIANDAGSWVKVPQLGTVVIGDDVEIGANTSVDRGALGDTVIEEGVRIDNQVQVAHNVFIGAHTAIAGCVGISGSARVGRHCLLAGGVGIVGHLEIADHVTVTGMSMVTRSIRKPGVYSSGLSVMPNDQWNRIQARLRRLDELARRVRELEQRIESLE